MRDQAIVTLRSEPLDPHARQFGDLLNCPVAILRTAGAGSTDLNFRVHVGVRPVSFAMPASTFAALFLCFSAWTARCLATPSRRRSSLLGTRS